MQADYVHPDYKVEVVNLPKVGGVVFRLRAVSHKYDFQKRFSAFLSQVVGRPRGDLPRPVQVCLLDLPHHHELRPHLQVIGLLSAVLT